MSTPFIEENDQTRARREHLERIRELVGNAYPNKFRRTSVTKTDEGEDTITSVVRDFKSREPRDRLRRDLAADRCIGHGRNGHGCESREHSGGFERSVWFLLGGILS